MTLCSRLTHPKDITPRETVLYALHFLISLLTMEILIYMMPVVAIKDPRRAV
ncbi:hypothetical protein BGW80DRAFT_1391231 [Lactifluus volemus]|nr:hypothetical protein BGW80DRAFT_1391231 [Lactifluus volemus]